MTVLASQETAPAGAVTSRYLHETDAALRPGALLLPAQARAHRSRWQDTCPAYDPTFVYVTDLYDPEYAGILGTHGQYAYLVEPLGPVLPDPEIAYLTHLYRSDEQACRDYFGDDEPFAPYMLGHGLSARVTTSARVLALITNPHDYS